MFDGPGRAIQCALEIVSSVKNLGLTVRAGLHAGECELVGSDIAGVAVHITARVAAKAKGNEVLVSSTVKDLVSGSNIKFEDKGTHSLKGGPITLALVLGLELAVKKPITHTCGRIFLESSYSPTLGGPHSVEFWSSFETSILTEQTLDADYGLKMSFSLETARFPHGRSILYISTGYCTFLRSRRSSRVNCRVSLFLTWS